MNCYSINNKASKTLAFSKLHSGHAGEKLADAFFFLFLPEQYLAVATIKEFSILARL